MKKLISSSLVALLCTGAIAQEVKSTERQLEKKSTDIKANEATKTNSLDGRSFKIAFTERQAEVKPVPQTGASSAKTDVKSIDKPVSDYSVFDANSKVMLSFANGKLLSPIFMDDGCAYRINTSGNEMYAFSSYCRLNTGNQKGNDESTAHDSKMEMDAANSNQPVTNEPGSPDIMTAPATVPPDETKQHLPPGVAHADNADMNTPPAGNVSPTLQDKDVQQQVQSPVKSTAGSMATISGVVNGNTIHGTLTWTEADGKKMNYAFTGGAATKKDMNDSQVVGMK